MYWSVSTASPVSLRPQMPVDTSFAPGPCAPAARQGVALSLHGVSVSCTVRNLAAPLTLRKQRMALRWGRGGARAGAGPALRVGRVWAELGRSVCLPASTSIECGVRPIFLNPFFFPFVLSDHHIIHAVPACTFPVLVMIYFKILPIFMHVYRFNTITQRGLRVPGGT